MVVQLQAHLAPQDHGIKCGQRFALPTACRVAITFYEISF